MCGVRNWMPHMPKMIDGHRGEQVGDEREGGGEAARGVVRDEQRDPDADGDGEHHGDQRRS